MCGVWGSEEQRHHHHCHHQMSVGGLEILDMDPEGGGFSLQGERGKRQEFREEEGGWSQMRLDEGR